MVLLMCILRRQWLLPAGIPALPQPAAHGRRGPRREQTRRAGPLGVRAGGRHGRVRGTCGGLYDVHLYQSYNTPQYILVHLYQWCFSDDMYFYTVVLLVMTLCIYDTPLLK